MQARVENIHWLSREAEEAEVLISSAGVQLLAFCCPCTRSVGTILREPLHAFSASQIQLSDSNFESIENTEGFKCKVVGTLIDHAQQLILACDFLIQIDDYLPGGIQQGDIISFNCSRIDLW